MPRRRRSKKRVSKRRSNYRSKGSPRSFRSSSSGKLVDLNRLFSKSEKVNLILKFTEDHGREYYSIMYNKKRIAIVYKPYNVFIFVHKDYSHIVREFITQYYSTENINKGIWDPLKLSVLSDEEHGMHTKNLRHSTKNLTLKVEIFDEFLILDDDDTSRILSENQIIKGDESIKEWFRTHLEQEVTLNEEPSGSFSISRMMQHDVEQLVLSPNMTRQYFRKSIQEIINQCNKDIDAAKAGYLEDMKRYRINSKLMKDDMMDRQLELKLYEQMCSFNVHGSIATFEEWKDHVQGRMDKHLFGDLVVHEISDIVPESTRKWTGEDRIALELAEEFKSRTAATRSNLLCMCAIVQRGVP